MTVNTFSTLSKPESLEALFVQQCVFVGHRLREGGFEVDNLLYKLRQCKLSAGSQVHIPVHDRAYFLAKCTEG